MVRTVVHTMHQSLPLLWGTNLETHMLLDGWQRLLWDEEGVGNIIICLRCNIIKQHNFQRLRPQLLQWIVLVRTVIVRRDSLHTHTAHLFHRVLSISNPAVISNCFLACRRLPVLTLPTLLWRHLDTWILWSTGAVATSRYCRFGFRPPRTNGLNLRASCQRWENTILTTLTTQLFSNVKVRVAPPLSAVG